MVRDSFPDFYSLQLTHTVNFTYNANGYVASVAKTMNMAGRDSVTDVINYTYGNNKLNFSTQKTIGLYSYAESGNAIFYSNGALKQLYLLHTGQDVTSSYAATYNFYQFADTVFMAKSVSGVVEDTAWFLSEHYMGGANYQYYSQADVFWDKGIFT